MTYSIKNLNIIFTTSIRKINLKLLNININNSIILNNIMHYKVIETFENGSLETINNIDVGQNLGFTYRLGLELEKQLCKRSSLTISPFWNYKFGLDASPNSKPQRYDLNDDRISFGISVGTLIFF